MDDENSQYDMLRHVGRGGGVLGAPEGRLLSHGWPTEQGRRAEGAPASQGSWLGWKVMGSRFTGCDRTSDVNRYGLVFPKDSHLV